MESGVAHCTSQRLIMIVTPVTQEIVWSVGVQLVVASLLWLFFPKDAEECIPPTDTSLNRLPNQALHLSFFLQGNLYSVLNVCLTMNLGPLLRTLR